MAAVSPESFGEGRESPNSLARRRSAADPEAGGVSVASSDDVSARAGLVGEAGIGLSASI
jgi:hypothetical protein